MRLDGIPKKIFLDRDAKFSSRFWKVLFASLSTNLAFNISYHCREMDKQRGSTGFWRTC